MLDTAGWLVGGGWAHLEKHWWRHYQPGSSCCSLQTGGRGSSTPLSPRSPFCLASSSSSRNWAPAPTHCRRNTVTQTEFTKGERGPRLVGQKSTRPPIRRNVTFQNSRVGSDLCWLKSRAAMLQGGGTLWWGPMWASHNRCSQHNPCEQQKLFFCLYQLIKSYGKHGAFVTSDSRFQKDISDYHQQDQHNHICLTLRIQNLQTE